MVRLLPRQRNEGRRLVAAAGSRGKPIRPDLSPPVWGADAVPKVFHLIEMFFGPVALDVQRHHPRGQSAHRLDDRIGGYNAVTLRRDQANPSHQQLLLRVEHVEGGTLTNASLFP